MEDQGDVNDYLGINFEQLKNGRLKLMQNGSVGNRLLARKVFTNSYKLDN